MLNLLNELLVLTLAVLSINYYISVSRWFASLASRNRPSPWRLGLQESVQLWKIYSWKRRLPWPVPEWQSQVCLNVSFHHPLMILDSLCKIYNISMHALIDAFFFFFFLYLHILAVMPLFGAILRDLSPLIYMNVWPKAVTLNSALRWGIVFSKRSVHCCHYPTSSMPHLCLPCSQTTIEFSQQKVAY